MTGAVDAQPPGGGGSSPSSSSGGSPSGVGSHGFPKPSPSLSSWPGFQWSGQLSIVSLTPSRSRSDRQFPFSSIGHGSSGSAPDSELVDGAGSFSADPAPPTEADRATASAAASTSAESTLLMSPPSRRGGARALHHRWVRGTEDVA